MFPRFGKKVRLISTILCLLVLVFWMFLLGDVRERSTRLTGSWNDNNPIYGNANVVQLPSRRYTEQTSEGEVTLQGAYSGTVHNDSTEVAQRLSARQKKRFPGIFIVGFGKSGTKALYEVLKMHPKLEGPAKEVRFFSLHFSEGLSWYLKILPNPPIGGTVIEKSPDYILTSEAAVRLKEAALSLGVLPSSLKFVVMVRNPVVRAVSEYLEWKITKASKGQRLPPLADMILDSDETIRDLPFLNTSCYSEHIQKWFHYFHKKQFCFVDGDEFVSNPFKQVTKLEACLGLTSFFVEENFVYKEERGFYCFKRHSLSDEKCMNKSKGRKHPVLSAELLSKLKDYFNECNQQFCKIVGDDFHWEDSDQY